MNNKITFCSHPDIIDHTNCYAIKNYDNNTIKFILNNVEQDASFYLINENDSNEWLISVMKHSKIIFDCSITSLDKIKQICQKKH